MLHGLSLRQLNALIEIGRHGKVVAAARSMNLTPPAVTLQLRQAEETLGLVLFDRTADGMVPTDAGQAAIRAARAIDEQLRVLADDMAAIKGLRKGTLRLGVVSTAKYFAPRIMAAFRRLHPDIEMTLTVGNRAEIIRSLLDHSIDTALMGRPPRDFPVRAQVFGDHPLVIIAAPDHELVGRRDISRERIATETFLVREPGSGTRISLEIFFAGVPEKQDQAGIEMGSNETIKQAVMAGLGVAFLSAHTIAAEVEAGRLAILDVEGMPVRRQWFSVSRAERAVSPAMQAFAAFLASEGARYLPLVGDLYRAG